MAVFPFTTFDNPLATNNTSAFDINDAGQIVGYYQDSRREAHGFLLSGGTYTTPDVSSANPAFGTLAQGINDAGQIVGYYEGNDLGFHGFLYSGGTPTLLSMIPHLPPAAPRHTVSTMQARSSGRPTVTASSLSLTAKARIATPPSTFPRPLE